VRDARGADALSYDLFFQSLFELADLWCPVIEGRAYAVVRP